MNPQVPISKIHADPNQPRKMFEIIAMGRLAESIKKHGIINPLIVEKDGDGYLLIDGERRYRAAKEVGIKEVPIVILASKDPVERTIEQFHIQEMHEGWTPVEKAQVIKDLSEEMKKPFMEVCAILGVSRSTARNYVSLGKLNAKNEYSNANIRLEFAEPIIGISKFAKAITADKLEENFTLTDQRKLEKKIIDYISEGIFTSSRDVTKLKDTFKSDPKTIVKFMDGADANELYIKSKARSSYYLRNVVNNAGYITQHSGEYIKRPDTKATDRDITTVKRAIVALNEILQVIED